MMKPRLLAADGSVVFEFDDDKAMRAVMRNTIRQARHGREMRLHFLLNDTLAALLDAIEAHGRAAGDRSFQPMPAGIARHVVHTPPHEIATAISQELFQAAPDLGWNRLSQPEKEALVHQAFLPYRLDEAELRDTIEMIDHWIARYRDS